jgi:hypothetical protein
MLGRFLPIIRCACGHEFRLRRFDYDIRRPERRLGLEFSWNCDFPFAYKSENVHVMAKILMPKCCWRNLTDSLIPGQRQNDCISVKKQFINVLCRQYPQNRLRTFDVIAVGRSRLSAHLALRFLAAPAQSAAPRATAKNGQRPKLNSQLCSAIGSRSIVNKRAPHTKSLTVPA